MDFSAYQVGCALFQTKPDGFKSQLDIVQELLTLMNGPVFLAERECIAMVSSLQTLQPCFMGTSFTFNMDRSALRCSMSIAKP